MLRKAFMVIVAGLVVAAAVPTFASAAKKVEEVLIANEDSDPVPTKAIGETLVGDGDGPLTVDGSMSISGTPSVNVGNGDADAIPVRQPGEPFNATEFFDLDGGVGRSSSFSVPADKTLILEFVSVRDIGMTGGWDGVTMTYSGQEFDGTSSIVRHVFDIADQPLQTETIVAQQTSIRIPGGGGVTFTLSSAGPSEAWAEVNVSGLLVDA